MLSSIFCRLNIYRKAMILPFASSGQVLLGIPKSQILSVLSETKRTKSLLIGIDAYPRKKIAPCYFPLYNDLKSILQKIAVFCFNMEVLVLQIPACHFFDT